MEHFENRVKFEVRAMTEADFDGIAALLYANAPEQGGTLTGYYTRDRVAWILGTALYATVAVDRESDGAIVGILFAMAKDVSSAPPVIRAMIEAWPGRADAYVYGPVCIAESARGQGLLPRLYAKLGARLAGREAILFIRRDNEASIRAHLRLGMIEVAGFVLDGTQYAVLSSAQQVSPDTACVILAAGRGRRFGSDKRRAEGPWSGPLLHHVLGLYRPLFGQMAVVIGPDDSFGAEACRRYSARTLINPEAELGMGRSLAVGAGWLIEEGAVCAVIGLADMPWISPDTIAEVAAVGRARGQPVAPAYRGTIGFPRALPAVLFPTLAKLSGDPYVANWTSNAKNATRDELAFYPNVADLTVIVGEQVQAAVLGQKTVAEAIDNMSKRLSAAIV